MIDLTKHIEADSDCLVAADLVGGPLTILVERVTESGKNDKKKIDIFYANSEKPFRPCKSMLRILCELWKTTDATTFIGRGITLYREPDCMWKGEKTPGVRICGLSHIEKAVTVVANERRGKMATYQIEPIRPWPPAAPERQAQPTPEERLQRTLDGIARASIPALEAAEQALKQRTESGEIQPDQAELIRASIEARAAELAEQEPTNG
jgi:hypothetical protein